MGERTPADGVGPRRGPGWPGVHVGEAVLVHSSFEDTWVGGFEIAAVVDGGYQLRRQSDGELLPELTGPADVRSRRGDTPSWPQRPTGRPG